MKNVMVEKIEGTPFFTLTAAAVGGIAGVLTGSVLLAPVGMLAGFLLDTVKCDECGSKHNVHEALTKTNRKGKTIYTRMPFKPFEPKKSVDDPFQEPPQEYLYDEIEGRFTLLQDADDFTDTSLVDTPYPDFQTDCDVTYDFGDTAFETQSPGDDGFGDSGSDFGMGDGGDFGSGSNGEGGAGQ
jgi:hypothetical protein